MANLPLNFGYVAGMKPRTSANFEPMSAIAGVPQVNRGTSFAGFLIGSEERTYLGAIGQMTWDLFSCTYVQGGQTWQFSQDLEIRGDAQFIDQRSVGNELLGTFDTQLYGARLTASYGGALLSLEFTDTAEWNGHPQSLRRGSFLQLADDFQLQSSGREILWHRNYLQLYRARTQRRQSVASYAYGSMPAGRWEEEINATVDYRITTGALKNCWLRLRYAHNASNGPVPTEDFRVIFNYAINF